MKSSILKRRLIPSYVTLVSKERQNIPNIQSYQGYKFNENSIHIFVTFRLVFPPCLWQTLV